jgi:hypothetical protein
MRVFPLELLRLAKYDGSFCPNQEPLANVRGSAFAECPFGAANDLHHSRTTFYARSLITMLGQNLRFDLRTQT